MILSGHRFLTEKKDLRQWSHQRTFGAVSLPSLPITLARTALAVFDQQTTNFCTAFSTAGALSFRIGYPVSPEFQTAMEGQIDLEPIFNGTSLNTACKAPFVFGILSDKECPLKLAKDGAQKIADWNSYTEDLRTKAGKSLQGGYYTAHKGKYDAFDNIRSTISNAKDTGQEVAVVVGTHWYQEFNEEGSDRVNNPKAIMSLPVEANISDHAWVIYDWEPDGKGDFNALALLSSGTKFGDGGILRFPRSVINFLMAQPVADSRVIEARGINQGSIQAQIMQYLLQALYQLSALLNLIKIKQA